MKTIYAIFILSVLTLNAFGQEFITIGSTNFDKRSGVWYQIDEGYDYLVVDNRITIKFKSNVSDQEISNFASSNNFSLFHHDTIVGYFIYIIPANEDIIDILISLQDHHLLEIAETQTFGNFLGFDQCEGDGLIPDDEFYFDSNDPYSPDHQWYLPKAGIDCAWQMETGNSNVIVAILDTGVDHEHPDIGLGDDNYQNIIEGWNFVNGNSNTMDNCSAGNCHGTKMAGIVAAKTNNTIGITGIAGGWNDEGVKILPIVIGTANIDELHLISGINYVLNETAAKTIGDFYKLIN